jgi:hypothetical protein
VLGKSQKIKEHEHVFVEYLLKFFYLSEKYYFEYLSHMYMFSLLCCLCLKKSECFI